jgi:hypothetical protein
MRGPRAGYHGPRTCGTKARYEGLLPLRRNGGQVDLKKLLTLIVVALALFFVFTRPQAAGSLVTNGLGLLKVGAEQVVAFITTIV